jgi:catechol 2,3-dioxygenase-like lactoylglutathione lyase family enzyme
MNRGFEIKALGEIAIRCGDMPSMVGFYRDILGLEALSGDETSDIVFFKIAPGHAGHTSVLALFRYDAGRAELHPIAKEPPQTGARSSLHHIALSVDFAAQEAAIAWLQNHDLPVQVQVFDWVHWRGVFTQDPEGNTVELVAFDPSFAKEE